MGGYLFSNLYALPTLKPHGSSFYVSRNLANPNQFKTVEAYTNEYLAMHTGESISKAFRAKYVGNFEVPGEKSIDMLPTVYYLMWARETPDRLSFDGLLSRSYLENWVYSLFLKLYIPLPRAPGINFSMIYTPMNMTVFYRLLTRLYEIGYPAHWLSGIVTSIVTMKVMTNARAPRSSPLSLKEPKLGGPVRPLDTEPFVPEMSTLAAIWRPVLPFGIMADSSMIPNSSDIYQYTIRFSNIMYGQGGDGTKPEFVIFLMTERLYRFSMKSYKL